VVGQEAEGRLRGRSLREYFHFAEGQYFPPVTLQEVLAKTIPLSLEISQKVRPVQFFEPYLNYGYYPFFKEDPEGYAERLRQIVNVVIESDIPAVLRGAHPKQQLVQHRHKKQGNNRSKQQPNHNGNRHGLPHQAPAEV